MYVPSDGYYPPPEIAKRRKESYTKAGKDAARSIAGLKAGQQEGETDFRITGAQTVQRSAQRRDALQRDLFMSACGCVFNACECV